MANHPNRNTQTKIIEIEGGFKLLGRDGYSTSEQIYPTRMMAEKARQADDAAEENNFVSPSPVHWVY